MAKLWEKGYQLDELVEEFTTGSDNLLDLELVVADCVGSIAHARMLESIGILTSGERGDLERVLRDISVEANAGSFEIRREDEDCHTSIEQYLIRELGEVGKKVHTGRSRNDQILTALRLVERSFLLEYRFALVDLIRSFIRVAEREQFTPMPGRTHLQIAMPSSVGLWAGGYAEQLFDQLSMIPPIYALVDRSPLGSSAGYGVPLPIDRQLTANLMGFSRVQNNVVAVASGRGEVEGWILSVIEHTSLTLSRLAQDLILFSLPEIGYFSLPDELCTGSSIMPQKKNPDILELMRARSATVSSYTQAISSIIRSLPSGYNRDLQETKEPTLRGMRIGLQINRIASKTMESLKVNRERLEAGFSSEIYATDEVFDLVGSGVSFREAYRTVAADLSRLESRNPEETIRKRTHIGSTGNLGLDLIRSDLDSAEAETIDRTRGVDAAIFELLGSEISLYVSRRPA